MIWILIGLAIIILTIIVVVVIRKQQYKELKREVLNTLGFDNWNFISYFDTYVTVKSRQALANYDDIKFFKQNKEMLKKAEKTIKQKNDIAITLSNFLESNEYKSRSQYNKIAEYIKIILINTSAFRIKVNYISSAGNNLASKEIAITQQKIDRYRNDPSLLMGKGEYNKYVREQQKEALNQKQHTYYERVNSIIDYANTNREKLVVKGDQKKLDDLIGRLFDRTVNSIKKIKTLDSEEWDLIEDFMSNLKNEIEKITSTNQKILSYYESTEFLKIKETCETLMSSQREFNEYINDKVKSISQLFGTRVVRNETTNDDEYNYIRPYKKQSPPLLPRFLQRYSQAQKTALWSISQNTSIPIKNSTLNKSKSFISL